MKDNRWIFLQMGLIVSWHAVCEATIGGQVDTGFPFDPGINRIQDALTGPIPKAASIISIAVAAMMWMLGQGQISQTAIRVVFGSGIALGSPTVLTALAGAGTGSGCTF